MKTNAPVTSTHQRNRIHAWLTKERLGKLSDLTLSARPLLLQAGLWRATLGYWVREQASLEAYWDPQDEKQALDKLEEQWRAKTTTDGLSLDPEMLRAKLRVGPASARWSRQQWGHRLDSLFLQAKSQLDRASCRVIRLSSKPLATELYHRIKAKETSFEIAAREFGEGPERNQNGLIPHNPSVHPLVLRRFLNALSQPAQPTLRLKGFVSELVELGLSQLDEATGQALLDEQLRLWIDSVVDVLESKLR